MTDLDAPPAGSPALPKILIVDDHAPNRLALRRLLARSGAELIEADSGNEALAACLDHDFALILLDVNMPEMDGFEVAELLGEDEGSRDTPIIFISAAYDDLHRLRGYGSGAVDYIAKPVNETILKSKVAVFLELYRRKSELQDALEQLSQHMRALEREVALRRETEKLAWHRASHDVLTDLPNRMLFMDRLDSAIERSRRHQRKFGLAYIDIDGFKPVNDTHGHPVGDELLKAIADRLRGLLRTEDTVARLGGDEFAVILESLDEGEAAGLRVCEVIVHDLRRPYLLDSALGPVTVTIGASVGLAMFPPHGDNREQLIRAADEAMYAAKRAGRNRCLLAVPG
ncbi:MAG: diguanylate cyclase [Gammaproteobacteria bacterium]|jgi:diguanylate cyclase (GGDEF)-like protein|uniref:diguanylate cyclase domain-containing protein n=1 Tax=Nevskia sp. TaxID=1929292 RepID=UPI004036FAC4|nr:diguanylate cyclase [Gammaproteobacteria bacterium]